MLDKLDLHAIRPLFPPLLYPDDIAGTLSDAIAAQTGLPAGIPVCAGALDVSAAALGIGAIHDGDIFTILGTTCCTGIVCRGLTQVSLQTRFVAHAWPGHYLNLFAMQSGTPNIDWALSTLTDDADFQTINARIARVPPGSGGVFYQPYLNGERAPFYSTSARAGFLASSSPPLTRIYCERSLRDSPMRLPMRSAATLLTAISTSPVAALLQRFGCKSSRTAPADE